uniref:Uncharacterized protein n=1 Tax=Heterorhabditis bacteriophora TaxID=37862 RepID=A0A1I7X5B5_HETBA
MDINLYLLEFNLNLVIFISFVCDYFNFTSVSTKLVTNCTENTI